MHHRSRCADSHPCATTNVPYGGPYDHTGFELKGFCRSKRHRNRQANSQSPISHLCDVRKWQLHEVQAREALRMRHQRLAALQRMSVKDLSSPLTASAKQRFAACFVSTGCRLPSSRAEGAGSLMQGASQSAAALVATLVRDVAPQPLTLIPETLRFLGKLPG